MNKASVSLLSVTALAALAILLPRSAHSETPLGVTSLAEARELYRHDVAACKNGAVDEDKRTCLQEARRAHEEAKREVMKQQHKRSHAKRDSSKQ